MCIPPCSASGECPSDKPEGVTGTPSCVLTSSTGDKYCALTCKPAAPTFDAQCGRKASCKTAPQGDGLCSYDDVPKPPFVVLSLLTATVGLVSTLLLFAERCGLISLSVAVRTHLFVFRCGDCADPQSIGCRWTRQPSKRSLCAWQLRSLRMESQGWWKTSPPFVSTILCVCLFWRSVCCNDHPHTFTSKLLRNYLPRFCCSTA
jgi:hypothetical protein